MKGGNVYSLMAMLANAFLGILISVSCAKNTVKEPDVVDQVDTTAAKGLTIEWDISTLQRLAPAGNRHLSYAGYPRVKRLADGRALAVYEADGNIELIMSSDEALSWTDPLILFRKHDVVTDKGTTSVNTANPELVMLENGWLVAACNYRPSRDEYTPFSIAISRSEDGGYTWSEPEVVFEAEPRFSDGCWEPSFLQLPDGTLQLYFANEKPYTASSEQEISVLESRSNGLTWEREPRTVSFRQGRRDGMPVPLLVGNEILVAIEDNKVGQFKPYIVRSSVENNWVDPVYGASPLREYALTTSLPDDVYAGAPYLTRLPSGEILLSYQTTRGRTNDWEKSTMEVAIGDANGRNFRINSQPFPVSIEREAKWNAIAVWDQNTVVATSASNMEGGSIGAWMILGHIKQN
ncbi:sialidase family protein [Parapedobacter sp. 2B3]|uniref:sialidase family protein n=1 Tax=Parapedobacter sp. 2B3 TaxID=3342381 RepID=UPI0035B587A4